MNNDKSEQQNQNVKPDKNYDPWRVIARIYRNSCNCDKTLEGECIACSIYRRQAQKDLNSSFTEILEVLSDSWPNAKPSEEPPCSCCSIAIDVEILPCGHKYCYICRGREHHDPCWLCEEEKENK